MDALLVPDVGDGVARDLLIERGHRVTVAGGAALAKAATKNAALVLVDVDDEHGVELVRSLHDLVDAGPMVIAFVAPGRSDLLERTVLAGADDFVERPVRRESLEARIRLLEQRIARVSAGESATQRALDAEANFAALLEGSPDPIAMHRGGKLTYANPAALVAFGAPSAEAFLGRRVLDFVHPDDRADAAERLRRVETTGSPAQLREERFLRWDGSPAFGEAYSCVIRSGGESTILTVGRDVTQPRELASQLRHAERLATIGTMTLGIAHELRNPLAFMLCNLEDLWLRLPEFRSQIPKDVLHGLELRFDALRRGAERMNDLARELSRFGRRQDDVVESIDIRKVLESALEFALPELRLCAVQTHFETAPMVRASALRLEQVFLNLLVNAGQALRASTSRDRRINVRSRTDSEGWAVIEIADSGPGIADEVRTTLFDPFVTTKPAGTGTGLGLPVSRAIVEELGGVLSVESPPGEGATFRVRLPPDPSARQRVT